MKFSAEFNFRLPIRFYNGYGRFSQLGNLIKDLGEKYLLVTGKFAMKKLGFTEKSNKDA